MSEACVILAAGRGKRMGGRNKALLVFQGKTFLQSIASQCVAAGIDEVVVVVAEPHLAETRAAAESLGLRWVCNETPEDGMASSVAKGFAYALREFRADFCWLWPVDVPAVSSQVLSNLSKRRLAASVVIPSQGKRGGHPVLVARSIWRELAECAGEPEGARSVFRRDPERVVRVPVDAESVRLDVDHPADLLALAPEQAS